MIKIIKKSHDDNNYMFYGEDEGTGLYCACITSKKQVDASPDFEQKVKDRIKFVINKKIGLEQKE